jgi:uncharacterized membrane protein
MQKNYQRLSQYSRNLAWLSYAGLLLVLVLNTVVWPTCQRSPNGVILAIQLVLLLVFLPGMLKQNVRTYVWLTFTLLGFFMASVSTAFACSSHLTLAEVLLIVTLFISAMMYVRWRSLELKQRASVS